MRTIFKSLLVISVLTPVYLGAITIAERDKAPEYTIVLPVEATASQRYAAKELQSFTAQMTGVELPIITDNKPLPAKAILLGVTEHTAAAVGSVDLNKLGDDGFTLKTKGNHLCIIGSGVRGTLYGVYELLEKHGGCRWYSSWHSRMPELDKWDVPELNDTQTPAFVVREPFWYDMFKGDFAARSRANGNRPELKEKHGGKIRFGNGMFVHTFNTLCPPDKYFDEHPEYFSLVKGKRRRERSQLCLTNPDVLKIVIAATLERIRKDPTAKLFSVSQNDWRNPCECPACAAIDEKEGTHAGTMILFVNKVAEAVEKEFPNVWIETLAYQYTRTPPKFVKPRHNVVPRLCTIECDFSRPLNQSAYAQNKSFLTDISGWSTMTDKLFIWDYVTDFAHYIGPFPNIMALQENIKIFRNNHVVALFEQGDYNGAHGEFAELKAWVIAKLLWNPEQDMNTLIDDFTEGYYGAGAPYVKEYLFALQKLFEDPEVYCRIFENISKKPQITDDFMRYAELLWSRAEIAVKDDPATLYNVRMGRIPVVYAQFQRLPQRFNEEPQITQDGYIKSVGAPFEHTAKAAELINLLDNSKERIFIREHAKHEGAIQRKLRAGVTGSKLLSLKNPEIEASISQSWGGCLVGLKLNGIETIAFKRGGVNLYPSTTEARQISKRHFNVTKMSSNLISMNTEGSRFDEQRIYSIKDEALTITTTLKPKGSPEPIKPVWRVPLKLGGAENIYWRGGTKVWRALKLAPDAICDTLSIPVSEIKENAIEIANAGAGRSVTLNFSGITPERCDIQLNRKNGVVELSVSAGEISVGSAPLTLKLSPSNKTEDLAKEPLLSLIRAVYEDDMFGLSKEGEWCVRVSDPAALNLSAIKLLNTHYEWCATMHIDQTDYNPGERYKLRMRVRVEAKEGVSGIALWAGIYDWENKKSHGNITKKTDSFKNSDYVWLDVAEWIPTDTHYFWIGPGRFDEKKETSAIEALYIDRVEMIELP